MKTYKQFQSITEVYKDLPVGRMSDKISKLSIDLGRQSEIRGREVYGGKRNAIRKSLGLNPKKRPERESPGRSEHISKQVLRLAKIKNAISAHDPELSGKLNASNRIRGAIANLKRRMSRHNQIVPFQRRKVQEAYMEIYGKDLNESLADMFAAAYDDLNKEAQKHASESQKRLKAIKKKMADAQQEIARQDAEIDTGMDMKRRPAKKKVEEAFKEPNLERMKRQAGWHRYSAIHIDLSKDIDRLARGKKIDSTIGYPDKPIYYRDKEGMPRRNVRHDVASFRGLENYLNKQNENKVRKGRNIQAKIQQYHNDPLGYMSKSFGGPTINPEGWQDAPKRRKTK